METGSTGRSATLAAAQQLQNDSSAAVSARLSGQTAPAECNQALQSLQAYLNTIEQALTTLQARVAALEQPPAAPHGQ